MKRQNVPTYSIVKDYIKQSKYETIILFKKERKLTDVTISNLNNPTSNNLPTMNRLWENTGRQANVSGTYHVPIYDNPL